MIPRIVLVVYKPFPGKEQELLALIREHVPVLRDQHLVTDRKPVMMKAADGSMIEIFEWKSAEAIGQAHANPVVQELWERFSNVCQYERPAQVNEFHAVFSEFDPLDL